MNKKRHTEKDVKKSRGRPATRHMPEPIPDTPENVAWAIMQGPPKKKWRYLDEDDEDGDDRED